MSEPRVVPPEEARRLADGLPLGLTVEKYNPNWAVYSTEWPETPVAKFSTKKDADGFAAIPRLAHTAAVLAEQREAVLTALLQGGQTAEVRCRAALVALGVTS